MQIEVYKMIADGDSLTITLEAICDSFSSLLWDIEYYKCGQFEVYIAASPLTIEVFQTGRIVRIHCLEAQNDSGEGDSR